MFIENVKKFMLLFIVVGVAGLLWFLTMVVPADEFVNKYALFDSQYMIGYQAEEGVFTFVRSLLLITEGIWLLGWAAFFFWMAKRSENEKNETTHKKVVNVEKYYFWGVATFLFVLVIGSFVKPYAIYGDKLTHFHAPDEPDSTEVHVLATDGFQWKFDINNDGDYSDDTTGFFMKGQKYKFLVTAQSFSHGMGIYSPDGVMRAQTNINPGITAVLYHTFEFSGDYTILCMEYCGIGHHNMMTTITVGGN